MRNKKLKFTTQDKNLFFPTLQKRVDLYFKNYNLSRHGDRKMVIKTMALLLVYIIPFYLIIVIQPSFVLSLFLWLLMGFAMAGIGMSVMHDGNHQAYSSKRGVNYLTGNILNILGASSFNWKMQHNILHHTYTNIDGMDEDIESKGIFRFSPHSPLKKFHKYQWIYAFPMYGLLTLFWVVVKDYIQFFQYIKKGLNTNGIKQNIVVFLKIILIKVIYFSVLLVIPHFVFGLPFLQVLTGFLLMHFVAGVILGTTFQLAHTVEGTHHPLPNKDGNIENEWAIHQLNTTANFSKGSTSLTWYLGGLNYQIEHHLFPTISHVHYPAISFIVKETAHEFNIPYIENKTFVDAIRSHVATLYRFSR